jgi:glycine/D-amino acid oxidase-like deaminating enzyme
VTNVDGYRQVSYWLETAGDDLTPRPRLDGSTTVDVAILGAGYTGLWTAYYLLRQEPSLRVMVLEAEIAGFGASGRNGTWVSAHPNLPLETLVARYGGEAARLVQRAMNDAVDEVGRVTRSEGIDADYVKGGALHIARGDYQVPLAREHAETYSRMGLEDQYTVLSRQEVLDRVRASDARLGLYTAHAASIHPGKLVRGLARTVEALGVRIHEQTPVIDVIPGPPTARLRTPFGDVQASSVVLAGEAYLTRLPQLHRQLLPIYSLIVLTEPLPPEMDRAVGWSNRECVSSFRLTVDYLARTADGRVMFGGRGAPYHFGSRIRPEYDRHAATHGMLRNLVVDWFPDLRDVAITHEWGGVLGTPRDWTPTFFFDPRTSLASARGYTGQGVATSNLAGRTLADLIRGTESERTALPYVNHRSPNWEPEPLRWLGVRIVQDNYARLDRRGERTGRPPTGRSIGERLAGR